MDSSAAREDHQDQIGLDVEAATGDTADVIRVPGEGSSTGNVTGGRKFARHYYLSSAREVLPHTGGNHPSISNDLA